MNRSVFLAWLCLLVAGCDTGTPIPVFPDTGPAPDGGSDAGVSMASCDNLERDGDETGTDCGGSCPGCPSGDPCVVADDCDSLVCSRGRCLVPTCTDGARNGDETGTDCGGDCDLCPGGEPCTSNDQCLSGRCRGGACAMSDCEDGRMNGDETDVDCGGGLCPACDGGDACDGPEDCRSLICASGACTDPACDDSVQNQDETSVDCGGAICPACRDGLACVIDSDCEGLRCFDGGCVSCTDGTKDAEETDVDCGGGLCASCADGLMCLSGSDCVSGSCVAGICESCTDGAQNQDETDVDCGGAACSGCADGLMCLGGSDCAGLGCESGLCVSCVDGVQNQDESDVDCGGAVCPACGDRLMCSSASDCLSTICTGGVCVSCSDGVQNQDETDVDCGGTTCAARCTAGFLCSGPSDCASAICDGPTGRCNAPGCGDGILNGEETQVDCGGSMCLGCTTGGVCVLDRDCLSGVCAGVTCAAPTCTDMVANGDETDIDCGGPTACPRCPDGRRCDADTDCSVSTCIMGFCGGRVPNSCNEFLTLGLSTGDGVYRIDADGLGGRPAYDVYCDMTTDSGGWTLTYKLTNSVPSSRNPWWDMVMPGVGTAFPTTMAAPPGDFEGPTLAERATFTTSSGATEWRASTIRAGAIVFDVASSYASTTGQAMRCFASGTCTSATQTCSSSVTDGRVLSNALGGPIGAGGTGFLCDVGWTGCSFCVDWSSVRTDSSAGGSTTNSVRYAGDSSIALTDTFTLYWIR